MNKKTSHFFSFAAVVVLLSLGVSLSAQQSRQRPDQSPQMEQQDTTLYPGDNPTDRPVASAFANSQSFTGTIVKSGDRYVLQAAHGSIYDLDNQEAVKPFEGKRVSLHGALEPRTKLIHLEQQ
jgi:trehalose-6-phosphatase